jgi:hypothetical protein
MTLVSRLIRSILVVALLSYVAAAGADEPAKPSPEAIEFFEAKIRPILVENCYECHSSKAKDVKGGLLLDTREGALQGGDSGAAVVPGDPNRSLLIQAIRYSEDAYQMPPKGKLPAETIADFESWIENGAADPRDEKPVTEKEQTSPKETHWSFQPIHRAKSPPTMERSWPRDIIDSVAVARIEQHGLAPSPEADRRTLLRRLSYDLTGLPASYEEIEAFVADSDPAAYEKRVDSLLASPAFGERWARHWLDVARYADTKGYVFMEDRSYPEAYLYRDWVTGAFNGDLPYDQFLRFQIAADRLAPDDPQKLAAMGFLTLGRRFVNNKHDIIDDRIDVITRGLLGLTVTCARCHDHKYDPIPIDDYYSLYGVFASSREPNDAPSKLRLIDSDRPRNARVFLRGNSRNQGDEVPRRFLAVLSGENRQPFTDGSGRLELANAIANPANPLTARVFVNRVWGHLFGEGLAPSASDFGLRSDPPEYPEILDDLARDFADGGWSVKELIRRIVLSSLYRQGSLDEAERIAADPENRWLARRSRRRLDFEALRDSLLVVGGGLDRQMGGASVKITEDRGSPRRSLYAYIDRQNLPGVFRAFDFASPDTHAPKRYETITPQQALFLLNNRFTLGQARSIGRAFSGVSYEDQGRLSELVVAIYRRVLARDPTSEESHAAVEFLMADQASGGDSESRRALGPLDRLAQVLMLSNEFVMLD